MVANAQLGFFGTFGSKMEPLSGLTKADVKKASKLLLSPVTPARSNLSSRKPRQRVKVEEKRSTRLNKILAPKTPVSKRYFTAGRGINDENKKVLKSKPSPFSYPTDMEVFAQHILTKAWRSDIRVEEMKLRCSQKPSYQGRHRMDLLNRLYIKEPLADTESLLKVDPQYLSFIDGVRTTDKIYIQDYLAVLRESLRTKIVTGYREDDLLLLQENLRSEISMINTIRENYQMYVDIFEEFLKTDHSSAMQQLQDAAQVRMKCQQMYFKYKTVAKKYAAIRSSLFNMEQIWRNCKAQQKLLYLLSPITWRRSQKTFNWGSIFVKDEGDEEENIFGRYRESIVDRGLSVTDILKQFHEEQKEGTSPQIYFTEPQQLIDVFRFMEMQNLYSLLHSEELAMPVDDLRDFMSRAQEVFNMEIQKLQEIIDRLEGEIEWEEQRVRYLEDLALKLIAGEFKKLIYSEEALNLHVFVEDIYETTIAPNDAGRSMVEMMKVIEEKYTHELLFLDEVPSQQVAQIEGSYAAEHLLIMRLAEKAGKQYAELERITKKINKAFEPPYEKPKWKDLKKRSPPLIQHDETRKPPRDLTEAETEYLEYFTDFCKKVDDPRAYGINIEEHPKESDDKGDEVKYGEATRL